MSRIIDPTLGCNFDAIYSATDPLPVPLGTTRRALNGRMYTLVSSTGAIANNTAVVVTEPAFTIAAGAGNFTTRKGAVNTGQRTWVESNAI